MDVLISKVSTKKYEYSLCDLGQFIAQISETDFRARIYPTDCQDHESLEKSIAYPFFILCRATFFHNTKSNDLLSLLTSVLRFLDSTGLLILYYLSGKLLYDTF